MAWVGGQLLLSLLVPRNHERRPDQRAPAVQLGPQRLVGVALVGRRVGGLPRGRQREQALDPQAVRRAGRVPALRLSHLHRQSTRSRVLGWLSRSRRVVTISADLTTRSPTNRSR